jgi:hypothetical protein
LGRAIEEISHNTGRRVRAAEGQLESARDVLQSLCDANSRDWGSRFLLAGVLADMGLEEEAIRHLRKAISQQPRFPEALNNLALLRARRDRREAEVHLRKALAIRPDYAAAWNNLGNLCVELSRIGEAADCYSKAISIDPEYAEAHTNRALISLLQGDFEQAGRNTSGAGNSPEPRCGRCRGPNGMDRASKAKRFLLHSEQGAGDTIQFIRYARLLHRTGSEGFVHCQESLRTLLEGMPEVAQVFSGPVPAPEFDVHAPLMSLPRLFGTRLDSIPVSVPGETPYLRPLPDSTVPSESGVVPGLSRGIGVAGQSESSQRPQSFGASGTASRSGRDRRRAVLQSSARPDAGGRTVAAFESDRRPGPGLSNYAATAAVSSRSSIC